MLAGLSGTTKRTPRALRRPRGFCYWGRNDRRGRPFAANLAQAGRIAQTASYGSHGGNDRDGPWAADGYRPGSAGRAHCAARARPKNRKQIEIPDMYPLLPVEWMVGAVEFVCYFFTVLVALFGCLMVRP